MPYPVSMHISKNFSLFDFAVFHGNLKNVISSRRSFKIEEWLFEVAERLSEIGERLLEIAGNSFSKLGEQIFENEKSSRF